jgi:hypothetical protein
VTRNADGSQISTGRYGWPVEVHLPDGSRRTVTIVRQSFDGATHLLWSNDGEVFTSRAHGLGVVPVELAGE